MRIIDGNTDDEADGAGKVNDDDDRVRGRRLFFIVIFVVQYLSVENKIIGACRKIKKEWPFYSRKCRGKCRLPRNIMPRKTPIAENTEK